MSQGGNFSSSNTTAEEHTVEHKYHDLHDPGIEFDNSDFDVDDVADHNELNVDSDSPNAESTSTDSIPAPYVKGLMPKPKPTVRTTDAIEGRGLRQRVNPPSQYEPVDFRLKQPRSMLAIDEEIEPETDEVAPCSLHPERVYFTIENDDEPNFFSAIRSAEKEHWMAAILAEKRSLQESGTYTVTVLPVGAKTIGSKWVLKRKRGRDGEITKYKARLVAKGFSQIPGVHFHEVFAPTLRMTTFRALMANAAHHGWHFSSST